MTLVDAFDDESLSSQDARLIDVARNAVDSWVDRRARRKNALHYADQAMEDLERLVNAIDRSRSRRLRRHLLPVVTFLVGIVMGALMHWILAG